MDAIKTYSSFINKYADNKPKISLNLIKLGLLFEYKRLSKFPPKEIPKALQYLNTISLKYILEPLSFPDESAWVNLFAPVELLHSMGIYPMSIEGFSSFMSGFKCEDYFIDYAEKIGISETLCSYHKAFIGTAEAEVLPKPKFSLTTSMICDANINTFRHISDKYSIPCCIIDVPNEYSRESQNYVVTQLKETISMIEDIMGKKLDFEKLKEVLRIERESKIYMNKYINLLKYKYYPNTLSLEMYMLLTSHIFIGRKESYYFYKMLYEDIKNSPEKRGLRIYWVHLLPFYHETLKEIFNISPDHQILGFDLDFDYLEDIDYKDPLEALAKKMITNQYNGNFERKINSILNMIDKLQPDGVINFCQWGCRQSSGGVMLLKDALNKKNIPLLILDGDAIDRRNSHNGQIKTRLDAFFEIIENKNKGEEAAYDRIRL